MKRKDQETVTGQRRLRRHDDLIQHGILDHILAQEKVISEKTGKTQKKSVVLLTVLILATLVNCIVWINVSSVCQMLTLAVR